MISSNRDENDDSKIGGSTYIMREEVSVSRRFESFTKEVSQMAEGNEDHVADVGREQNVIGWVLFFVVGNGLSMGVLRGKTVFLVCTVTKLRMNGTENLF